MPSPYLIKAGCIHFFILFSQEFSFFNTVTFDCLLMFQATALMGGGCDPPSHSGPHGPSIPGCHGYQHWSPKFPQQGRGEWRSRVERFVVQAFRWSMSLLPVFSWLELSYLAPAQRDWKLQSPCVSQRKIKQV